MLSFVFTYLFPSLGMGLLLSLLWSQRRSRKLTVELGLVKTQWTDALRRINELNTEVADLRSYKATAEIAADAARELVIRAEGAAALAQQRAQEVVRLAEQGASPEILAKRITEVWNA